MIGIVVVSHSPQLARAAVDLAMQMVDPDDSASGEGTIPPVAIAAGLTDGALGTDAEAVATAITELTDPDRDGGAVEGVLVLLDLGSAVLSAEMALEFLDPDLTARVRLSAAPMVEGLIPALVTAAGDADLAAVVREAESGLAAKTAHLGPPVEATASGEPTGRDADPPASGVRTAELQVSNEHGLHARPAARLVQVVNRFASAEGEVTIRNLNSGRGPVDARSLTAVATLDARKGHTVVVEATGESADDLLDALRDLAAAGFGDDSPGAPDSSTGGVPSPAEDRPDDRGVAQNRGSGLHAAIGPARWVRSGAEAPDVQHARAQYRPASPADEADCLRVAVEAAAEDLRGMAERASAQVGAAEAAMFDAHLALLRDPGLVGAVATDLTSDGGSAPDRWSDTVEAFAEQFEGLTDDYQKERATDVRSVGELVLRHLLGVVSAEVDRDSGALPGIVLVTDLTPAQALALDTETTRGIITTSGGGTGHGVLLARSRGFPVLAGNAELSGVSDGTILAFDERTGLVWVDPDPEQTTQFEDLVAAREAEYRRAEASADEPAVTRDGTVVAVKANIGAADDAGHAAAFGADGAGLVRTELLFGAWSTPPGVAEQAQVFGRLVEIFDGSGGPVTIRTWDVGADKQLPYLPVEPEPNPFLGARGLRAFRDRPEVLVDQLEAVCRVAEGAAGPVRVMFPMVTTTEELEWALERLTEAAARVTGPDADADTPWPESLQVGIMVEVPAAVQRIEELSAQLDFVSIGSNDLTQYLLAADRGNSAVAYLTDHADPAVLAAISRTCRDVADGVPVALCGDAAADRSLVPVLLGLGVRELSVAPGEVPLIKAVVRELDIDDAEDLAARALRQTSADQVRALLMPPQPGETAR